jgi:SAM-dependent MidA family methyltransferase
MMPGAIDPAMAGRRVHTLARMSADGPDRSQGLVDVAPDARWVDSDPALVERLRDEIAAAPGHRITFARFMEMALTQPGLGYYVTSDERPTRTGDFLTAPELHPFFGRCIGRLLTEVWHRLGRPPLFAVQEWGAGRGTLATTAADGMAADGSGLTAAVAWQPIDVPGRHPVPSDAPITGAVIANEYLDALPVHRLVRRGTRLLERYVTWGGDWFAETEGELSDPRLEGALTVSGVTLANGQSAEVRPSAMAWLTEVAARLERGVVLVIDYGHPAAELYGPRHMAGTLVTYRDHVAGTDPFAAVGKQDLTAHVDLTALEVTARNDGLDLLGSTTQARLLVALGLGELLSDLGRDPLTRPEDYLAARASVVRMLDPRHLGGFRVLAFGRGMSADPPLTGLPPSPTTGRPSVP